MKIYIVWQRDKHQSIQASPHTNEIRLVDSYLILCLTQWFQLQFVKRKNAPQHRLSF